MDISIRSNGVGIWKRFMADAEGSLWDKQDIFAERMAFANLLQFAGKLVQFEVRKYKKKRVEMGVVLRLESVGSFKNKTTNSLASYEGRFIVKTKKGLKLVERRLFKSVHGDLSHFRHRNPRGFPYDDFFFNTEFDIDVSSHGDLLVVS